MKRNTLKKIAAVCCLMLVCGGQAQAEELTVSAAISLTNAFNEMKPLFEKKHAGVTLVTNFAASNPLLQQIREGAPVDVFVSADQETMDKAQTAKLIDAATRKDFARNALVMVVPSDGKATSVQELTPKMRVALGNPDSVPAGRYTRDALTSLNAYDRLQPAFILGNNVRQVLDYVARGEVDAGFVYASDAVAAKGKVSVVQTMTGHKPILYPAALVTASKHKKTAQEFVDFLMTPEAGAILEKYGFTKP